MKTTGDNIERVLTLLIDKKINDPLKLGMDKFRNRKRMHTITNFEIQLIKKAIANNIQVLIFGYYTETFRLILFVSYFKPPIYLVELLIKTNAKNIIFFKKYFTTSEFSNNKEYFAKIKKLALKL